jgi:hypothetical protein
MDVDIVGDIDVDIVGDVDVVIFADEQPFNNLCLLRQWPSVDRKMI